MEVRRDDDAQIGTGGHVHVREDATWANDTEVLQTLEQCSTDGGAPPNGYERFAVAQAALEFIEVLSVVRPDRDLVGANVPKQSRVRTVSK